MTNIIESQHDLEHGIAALSKTEPRFADIVRRTGLPPLRRRAEPLAGLLHIIVSQQLSKASAEAIWRRLEQSAAPFDPAALLGRDDGDFRAVGLSRPKVRTIRSLCAALVGGELDLADLARHDDDSVHERLTVVKGIGPWTADIYLLSCLGRADAWPAGDLALQVALCHAFGLAERPGRAGMVHHAAPWRPWRAIAARLLWSWYAIRNEPE